MPKTEAFNKLMKAMKKEYLGEEVPKTYRKQYGKMYNLKDVEAFAYAVAKKKRIPIE